MVSEVKREGVETCFNNKSSFFFPFGTLLARSTFDFKKIILDFRSCTNVFVFFFESFCIPGTATHTAATRNELAREKRYYVCLFVSFLLCVFSVRFRTNGRERRSVIFLVVT